MRSPCVCMGTVLSLVGFGMGARLVFKCLLYLSEMGTHGHGVVESAVCMGTPLPASPKEWYRAQVYVVYFYYFYYFIVIRQPQRVV